MKRIFTFEEFQKHLEKGIEIEKKQEPFKNWLVNMNNEFKDYITKKYTIRTANKHSFIIDCFIDFITHDIQLMDIQQITKGIANSYFQQWFASKIGANTKEEVKVAINKFIKFLAIEKGIVIENLQPKSKKNEMIKNKIFGEWHIQEMEMWDADYFNMEVQAYIKVNQKLKGKFQFGLVTGQMNGKMVGDKYEFVWEGNDEAHGSGWLKIKENNMLDGEFRFYEGDNSKFIAKRYK